MSQAEMESSEEKRDLDHDFGWATITLKVSVDPLVVAVSWAGGHIGLGFKREVRCGFATHRKAEGLERGHFSPVSPCMGFCA